jgi:hypothetical protein
VEIAQAPQPALPQHYVPPRMYQPAVHPPAMGLGMQPPAQSLSRVPDTRQRKLGIRHFDGKELYQGLGSGFAWAEEVKVDILGHHLTGMAGRYYNQQVEGWWDESPTLEHAMQRLLHTFATKITPAQSMKMFTAPKSAKRSWTEHYLYLVAVSEACGGVENLMLDNIVHYAEPGMRVSMLLRLNLSRTDYLRQAEELAHFAQSTEIQLRMKHIGHNVVNGIHEERVDTRKCFGCGKQGHLKAACPSKMKKGNQGGDVD